VELREVTRLKPEFHEARSYLAIGLAHQGLLDEALAAAREAVRLEPKDGLAHDSLGFALHKKGQVDDAIVEYRKAIRLTPGDPRFHNDLGAALLAKGLLDESIRACREAIRLRPDFAWPHSNLGIALARKGELDEAVVALRRAASLDPNDASAHDRLALALRKKGVQAGDLAHFRDAIAAYSRSVDLDPQSARALNNLAWALATCPKAELRDGVRAVELAKRAVELGSNVGNHWNTLGAAHYRAGDWQAAVAALEKSMELRQGGDSLDWLFLAMTEQRRGDPRQARAWYDRAADWMEKHQPNNDELLCLRGEAAELLGIGKGKD
jgi:Flp pilus assembly protein TadD